MSEISNQINVHDLKSVKLQALWVLDCLSSENKDRFSCAEISEYLIETCGIDTSRQAICTALERGKKLVHKNKVGYKIMRLGTQILAEVLTEHCVIYIESNKPFSAKNIALKDIFSKLGNNIFICDPYIDTNILDIIFKQINKKQSVKILTQNIFDKPAGIFNRQLMDLRKEGFFVEIGVYSNSDLHDRYIMDDKIFWLSGNSLNHLGNKESFIVCLGEDIKQSMRATFDNRWKAASKI
jgi:hypothetical protein